MTQVVYATTNPYKLQLANNTLKTLGIELIKLDDGLREVDEIQNSSQEQVAIDKAKRYYQVLKRPLVVMDSGLFVHALQGFPGVYTKYALQTIGIDGLLALLSRHADKTAYTQRTVVFTDGEQTHVFTSKCHGILTDQKKGVDGRDYDFYFIADDNGKTLAEMTMTEKAHLNGEAWRQFGRWLQENYDAS